MNHKQALGKVLILRFSSIGDIVLTSPVVRCLKSEYPLCEIHYFTKKAFLPIVESNPYVDKVHSFEKNISEVIGVLQKENFDLVVDLHNNLRSAQTKQKLGKPTTTFTKLNFKKWVLVNFKINKMPGAHVVDRYLQTVEKYGVRNDGKGLDYFIPENEEISFSTLPASHQHGFIGFVIGAKHATKQLPINKIIAICKTLSQPIVLLGGKEDEHLAEEIRVALGEKVYNACGKYSIHESASLVKMADKIVSHDTGLMHIAAAFKKEIISIWGNTVPSFGFSPYQSHPKSKIVEVSGLSCRPCSKIGYNKCPKGHFKCMNEIDLNQVRFTS